MSVRPRRLRALALVAALAGTAGSAAHALAEPPPRVRVRPRAEPARPADGAAPRSADAGGGGSDAPEPVRVDGGKGMRFGELEIEGRLKSPQIVYFLRRVRAEFAADGLGHRSFVPELEETRGEPVF